MSIEEANREVAWLRVQVGYLWEFLIAEDMEVDAQDYIAKQEGYESHDTMMRELSPELYEPTETNQP